MTDAAQYQQHCFVFGLQLEINQNAMMCYITLLLIRSGCGCFALKQKKKRKEKKCSCSVMRSRHVQWNRSTQTESRGPVAFLRNIPERSQSSVKTYTPARTSTHAHWSTPSISFKLCFPNCRDVMVAEKNNSALLQTSQNQTV